MARRRSATWASALCVGLVLTLNGCGGSGEAAATKADDFMLEGEKLDGMVGQVAKMGIVEWHGQLLTKNPDNGGKRIFDLDGRYSPSTGYSELSMDSAIGGDVQQVDYLVVAGRTYFNSEVWGPNAADCWADITEDQEGRSWALPTDLDPTWPVTAARAVKLAGDGVAVGVPAKDVLDRHAARALPRRCRRPSTTSRPGRSSPRTAHLIEVGVDVLNMWNDAPRGASCAAIDTRKAGWWAMTMKESQDGTSIAPPKYVFDPAVTPPSQCKRG